MSRHPLYIVCFKWKPQGERRIPSQDIVTYGAEHVNKLYSMIQRNTSINFEMILVTDEFDPDVDSSITQVSLWNEFRDLGGCYPRLKMYDSSDQFRSYLFLEYGFAAHEPRFICMDLDMIITGNIDHILSREEDFVYYRMPDHTGKGYRFNCGMWMMDYGVRPFVYKKFKQNPSFWINVCKDTPGSDQAWCNYVLDLDKEANWDINDGIYDMRINIIEKGLKELPKDCKIVMWPGPRDPSEKKWREAYSWIHEYWR